MHTILFVDVKDVFRSVAAALLRATHIEVSEVDTAQAGEEALAHNVFDLIIVSDLLPDGQGATFVEKLRTHNRSARIVFVSSLWANLPTRQRLDTYERLTADLGVCLVTYRPVVVDSFVTDILRLGDAAAALDVDIDDPNVTAEFETQRRHFTTELPAKLRAIEVAALRAKVDRASLLEARDRTHRLRNSVCCFGCPELADALRHAEDLLVDASCHPSPIPQYLSDEILSTVRDGYRCLDYEPAGEPILHAAAARTRKTLLVVDDDQDFLKLVATVGRKLLFNVVTAQSAAEALQRARSTPLVGAVIETGLGEARRFSLARAIRSTNGNGEIPIAFASLDHSIENRIAAIEAGGTRFLEKPISAESFSGLAQQLATRSDAPQGRVLAVIDDAEVLQYFALQLGSTGIAVETLRSADAITAKLDESRADVLLLDTDLAGISGLDVCRAIRMSARFELLPIVMVTSEMDDHIRLSAVRSGASDVMTKGATPEELLARVGVQLERSRLHRDRAVKDTLSGLLSRRAFVESFNRALAQSQRQGRQLATVLIDLDQFKTINDSYGHLVGDRVIARLGELLNRRLRQGDLRGRWGGEEFVLAFPGEGAGYAEIATKRLLDEFVGIRFSPESGSSFTCTFTAGIAAYPEDGAAFATLLHCADKRLYLGKQQGRNRVVVGDIAASAPPTTGVREKKNMKVLLIDDEEDIRKVAKLSLESVGRFETAVAASGREGIDLARVDRPDLILMDMMMPDMDGLAALAELKSSPDLKDIPVIFMTAKVQRSEIASYVQKGATGVIQKPFDPMVLPSEIEKILRTRATPSGP